ALRRGLRRRCLRCLGGAAARGAARLRFLLVGVCGRRGRDDLGQERLVLQLVEIAALGIAARGLPARDDRTRRRVELPGGLGIEAEAGEAARPVGGPALCAAVVVSGG